ncbi:MAG: hypothetical protein BroJett013_07300 [Alphaproteobacteria bacterium]|nr:MAG: hypothetical protein BroJett013_07300 [Alphaproteobacteria bacterium]
MPSQLSIVQHALDLLGETSITDLSALTEPAEGLLRAWDDVRDRALRARWWRFAIERTTLPAMTEAPAWGFDRQFQIDGDVVRVIQVGEYWTPIRDDYINRETSPFRVEGDKILTNLEAPLKVRWIVNSKDVGLWAACFAAVLACDLADRASTRVTGSESIKARIKQERADALREAVRVNALEQPPQALLDQSWIEARFSA